MKRLLRIAILGLSSTALAEDDFFFPAGPEGEFREQRPWTEKPFLNHEEEFQFVVVTDRTGGHRDGIFEQAISKINLLRPEFVVSVGDLVEGYYDNAVQSEREWSEFDGMVDALDMRFFYVPGNHDIWSAFSREEWDKRFGASYYHFVYRDVLFLALNSEDGRSTTVGPEQASYFVDVLEAHPEVRWTLVFTHKPLWYYDERGSETGWAKIQDKLEGRPHTVFAGHRHQYIHYERNGMRYIDLATTGGGSSLAGPAHGRFDHFVWVTMTDEGPVLANVLLDGVLDERVRTEETAAELDRLGRSFSLEMAPLTETGETPHSTTARMRNQADIPLEIVGRFAPIDRPSLAVAPHGFRVELPPNSVTEVPVSVGGVSLEGSTEDLLIPLDWQAIYNTQSAGEVLWEFQYWLAVESDKAIGPAPDAVVVDGKVDEWADWQHTFDSPMSISGARSTWTGPEDAMARFSVAADEEWIYVAGVVEDDVWVDKPGETVGSQDYLVLTLRPYRSSGFEASIEEELEPWRFSATPSTEVALGGARGPTSLEGGYRFAGLGTDTGYTFEFAVSIDAMESLVGETWDGVRVNLGIGDVDSHTGSRPTLWWKSTWGTSEYARALGRFRR